MLEHSSATPRISAGRWCRIVGACTFASLLGLTVLEPAKEAVGVGCQEEQRPATLILREHDATCTIAILAME